MTRTLILAAALVLAGACKKADTPAYQGDGDTGAAAPATQITPSDARAPDSTTGSHNSTGSAQMAGDTLGAKGRGAIGGPTTGDTAHRGAATTKNP